MSVGPGISAVTVTPLFCSSSRRATAKDWIERLGRVVGRLKGAGELGRDRRGEQHPPLSALNREELKDSGVTVTALLPGPTDTPFFARNGMDDTRIANGPKDDPDDAAADGFEAMMNGDERVVSSSLLTKAESLGGRAAGARRSGGRHRGGDPHVAPDPRQAGRDGILPGGMLTWAVALKHPRAFAAAFPAAGFLFPEMLEQTRVDGPAMPPIVAFHGGVDPLVSVDEDRRGVRLLEKRGVRVDLRVYPGVQHELPPVLVNDLFAALSRALAR